MICIRCHGENAAGVKYCAHCGAPLGLFCPHCGASNNPAARFCISCGNPIGAPAAPSPMQYAPPQTAVIVKGGMPGWAWGLIGILLGIVVIGGLGLSGILPFNSEVTALTPPPLEPVLASPEVSTQAGYCPESGGVILYWDASFACTNDRGDPGYRQRVGDGSQNLNTGQFDNQASSIQVPEGWSVRVYEDAGQKGASACIHRSILDLKDQGNFPGKIIPIDGNVSSMEAFRDGTCGEDLAAGAEPAAWPKDVNLGLDAPAGTACTDQAPCACLPQELKDLFIDGLINGENRMNNDQFKEKYVESRNQNGEDVEIDLKDFGAIFDKITTSGLNIVWRGQWFGQEQGTHNGFFEADCAKSDQDPSKITCTTEGKDDWAAWNGKPQPGETIVTNSSMIEIYYETENARISCAIAIEEGTHILPLVSGLEQNQPALDCRDTGCPSGQKCDWVNYSSKYICVNKKDDKKCTSSMGSSECAAAGGSWDSMSGCSCN